MIVLDTNVLSELMRRRPSEAVIAWLDSLAEPLWTTSITVFEICYGIDGLEDGIRRTSIHKAFANAFVSLIEPRVLAFDEISGRHAGAISARRERAGIPISVADCQIAAIVECNSAVLATRDVRDFADLELRIVDPWNAHEVRGNEDR